MKDIRLGDIVRGFYHGVEYTGQLYACDGSGYLYVRFTEHPRPLVLGVSRDMIAIQPDQVSSMRRVSRPEVQPEIATAPLSLLGGTYIK